MQLQKRYNMDPEIWQKSQRTSFLYRLTLNDIFLLSVVNIVVYCVIPYGKSLITDMNFITALFFTLVLSCIAFFITDIFIS